MQRKGIYNLGGTFTRVYQLPNRKWFWRYETVRGLDRLGPFQRGVDAVEHMRAWVNA